jgi:hypothetical protein
MPARNLKTILTALFLAATALSATACQYAGGGGWGGSSAQTQEWQGTPDAIIAPQD